MKESNYAYAIKETRPDGGHRFERYDIGLNEGSVKLFPTKEIAEKLVATWRNQQTHSVVKVRVIIEELE